MPKYLRDVIALIHDEVVSKYYGCGLTVPACLEGMNILDLGSGSGRDCYALSKLVGKNGFVTGVDMTDEQLEVANRHIEYHTKLFGYDKPNIKFVKGYIESLENAGIKDNSMDIIVSNCVINLCKDKKKVLSEAFRVLKDGGELYFSDVYADRELSEEIRSHEVLWGEGLGGAMYWKTLHKLASKIGFETPRIVKVSSFDVLKPDLKRLVGDAKYVAAVYRLFKLPANVERMKCQVNYAGMITGNETNLKLDYRHEFEKGKPVVVDGEIAAVLKNSRMRNCFSFSPATDNGSSTQTAEENPFDVLAGSDSKCMSSCSSSTQ